MGKDVDYFMGYGSPTQGTLLHVIMRTADAMRVVRYTQQSTLVRVLKKWIMNYPLMRQSRIYLALLIHMMGNPIVLFIRMGMK